MNSLNILDRLPNDVLYTILEFCGDQIQFNNKKNLICSDEFQKRLKMEHYDEISKIDLVERALRYYLNITYPVSSYTFIVSPVNNFSFDVSIQYRELGNEIGIVSYKKVNIEKTFTVYLEEHLKSLIKHHIDNLDGILKVDAKIIYENLYEQKNFNNQVKEIQKLIEWEDHSTLYEICNIDCLIEYFFHNQDWNYDGHIEKILGFSLCKEEIGGYYVTA
jgi:hypothetical protein